MFFFFFQAEDGIRDRDVTGVQTCALPIWILTTHAGALPRSPELREMIFARAEGKPYDKDALASKLRDEVAGVVRKQIACGIDSVNDGELGKTNFTNYVRDRIAGIQMRDYRPGVDPAPLDITARDLRQFPQYFGSGKGG